MPEGLIAQAIGEGVAPSGKPGYETMQQQYRILQEKARTTGDTIPSWSDFVKQNSGSLQDMVNPGGTKPKGVRTVPGSVIRG